MSSVEFPINLYSILIYMQRIRAEKGQKNLDMYYAFLKSAIFPGDRLKRNIVICTLFLYLPEAIFKGLIELYPGSEQLNNIYVFVWVSEYVCLYKYTHAYTEFLVLICSWYPGRSFSNCDVNWQVGCQERDERAWQRLQSMVIVFSSQPFLHCYFIYYLLYAWSMPDTLQDKRKDASLVSLIHFAMKHRSCAFCKRRDAGFLISVRHKPFKRKK